MGKGDEAKDNALSPEEMERLNRRSLDHQMEKIPLLQFDDIFANSETAQNSLFGKAFGAMNSMVDAGRESYANNPMRQLVSALAGERMSEIESPNAPAGITETDPDPVFTPPPPPPQPEKSAYEQRIEELMQSRGWSREEAVANQAHAMKQGTDYNNDGAVTNDEWAKYKKGTQSQQQGLQTGGGLGMTPQAPRDRSYGTTMPAPPPRNPQSLPMPQQGLQTGGGLGVVPQAPRDRSYGTTMPAPGTMQPTQPAVGQPATNPQSPGKGSGQKMQGYVQ